MRAADRRAAAFAEYQAYIEAHPETRFVDVMFTDPNGVLRGKRLEISELETVYRTGRPFPGSLIGLDVTGDDVEGTNLVWDDGDADRHAQPIPGTLVPQPWASEPRGQVLLQFHDLDGKPHVLDPRQVLGRVVDALKADGFHPVGAVELEFYLVDADSWARGDLAVPKGQDRGKQANAISEIDAATPFLDALYAACRVQGIPAMTAISEFGPGQFEITLHHRGDALRAVDEAILYKRAVRLVARRHGMEATFMAKPRADHSGSGMHLHLSLADDAGRNRFAGPEGETLLRHAIGGLARLMPDSLLLFAPNANSYRRYQSESYAPLAPSWGFDNRSVAFRVPAGAPESRHVEHRVAGADANPYLAMAAVLAGVHLGLRERLDPGPPVVGNAYAAKSDPIPPNWLDAIRAFSASEPLRAALGERFVEVFTTIKLGEWRRFHAAIPAMDFAWYFGQV